jgi:hypothetical protein
MIDLGSGGLDTGAPEDHPDESVEKTAAQLNKLLGAGKMPDSQVMLMDRIRRQLQGKGSLSTGQEDGERARRPICYRCTKVKLARAIWPRKFRIT